MGAVTKMQERQVRRLNEMDWNEIEKPGCYLFVDTGELVRIPEEALAPGHSPLIAFSSKKSPRVARLSNDPSTPISVLRVTAADHDYSVEF